MNDLLLDRFKEYFDKNYEKLASLLNDNPTKGLFLNTLKANKEEILKLIDFKITPSDFNSLAYYHNNEHIGKSKAYELGLIYPQGIESSYSSTFLNMENVNLIVDMCAAPGGKSINVINHYPNALCICNDIEYLRAKEMVKNFERLGLTNCVITSKSSKELVKDLKGNVDLVILDAPCSGEGIIRKYKDIIDEYSLKNINELSLIQKDLLEDAYALCNCDAYILYSTCTYAFEEDEKQINDFLSKHQDSKLIQLSSKYNYSKMMGTIKLCPLNNTEGQFIALIKVNKTCENLRLKYLKPIKNIIVDKFIKDNLLIDDYYLYKKNDSFYLSLNPLIDLKDNVIRYGIYLGDMKKDRFEPAHSLYRSIYLKNSFRYVYELCDEEYDLFVKGYEIKKSLDNHYYLLTYKNNSVGFGKVSSGVIKNKYPKGLRRL